MMFGEAGSGGSWWREGVVYQVYLRSFADGDGDGVGDLAGLRGRLPYFRDLGVDILWISPFYRSPMRDFGYDVADHCDVDPLFGTLEDFDALIREADGMGLRVVVDYIPNHTSSDHPWFSRSKTGPEQDWYYWRDPAPDGGPPNNWLSVFGGPAWTLDPDTARYYLHSFLSTMPDLNWRHPGVRAAMLDVLRFWLDRGVSGVRIDCAHFLGKDPGLRDNPPARQTAGMHKPMGEYDSQWHLHDKGHDDVHAILREVRALLDAHGDRVAMGETHIFDWDEWAAYFGRDADELHLPMNFALLATDWDAQALRTVIEDVDRSLPAGAWPCWVVGNHDEPRLASRLGPARARCALLLMMTLRGTPILYYGDELGLPDAVVPSELAQDPWGLAVPGLSRDPARSPMPWTRGPNGGFTVPEGRPWLPLAADPRTHSVEAQRASGTSTWRMTRDLLALRRESPALRAGSQTMVKDLPPDVFGFERVLGDDRAVVLINCSDRPAVVDRALLGRIGPERVRAVCTEPDGIRWTDDRFHLAGNTATALVVA